MPFPQVKGHQLALHTYIRNRDDYIFNKNREAMKTEFKSVLNQACENGRAAPQIEFFIQHSNPQAASVYLGSGQFATPAGEVLYRYSCPRVAVKAVEADRCYRELPVHLIERRNESRHELGELLYLEPLTHRLQKTAVPMPCSSVFASKWKTMKGWIIATPRLHVSQSPAKIAMAAMYAGHAEDDEEEPDFVNGGVLTVNMLDNMDEYQNFAHLTVAMGAKLAEQMGTRIQLDRELSPGLVFPQSLPHLGSFSGFLGVAFGEIVKFGNKVAGFMGIVWILGLIYYAFYVVFACVKGRKTRGSHWSLLLACLPAIFVENRLTKIEKWFDDQRFDRGRGRYDKADGADSEMYSEDRGKSTAPPAPTVTLKDPKEKKSFVKRLTGLGSRQSQMYVLERKNSIVRQPAQRPGIPSFTGPNAGPTPPPMPRRNNQTQVAPGGKSIASFADDDVDL
jgi:hypothetical protein